MRTVMVHRAGGYRRLELEWRPDPEPGPGEVLIDVRAIGVNYADCVTRMGLYQSARLRGWPLTPGFEVSGTVLATGDGIDGPPRGTEVIAVTCFGGYASRLCVPAHQVFALPAGYTPVQAAGFAVTALTAYHALFELAHPREGEWLLIHSAAGGVGTAMTQLGRIAGCHVVGVVGASHKCSVARDAGAEQVLDASAGSPWPVLERIAPRGFDIVADPNGGRSLRRSYELLAPTGRLLVYGFAGLLSRGRGRPSWPRLLLGYLATPRFDPLKMTTQNRSVLAFNLSTLFDRQDLLETAMKALLSWAGEGRLTPPPVQTYPLEEVATAHRDLERGQTVGKLVLVP